MTAVVTFNGLSLDVDPYHIEIIEGLLGPPDIRSTDLTRVGRSGLVRGTDLYGGRAVTLTINISAADPNAFGTAVSAFAAAFVAPQTDELPLTFTIPGVAGGTAARLNVRPRRVALPVPSLYFNGIAQALVELFATDALIYAEGESSIDISLAGISGGRSYDRVYPLVYSVGGSFGAAVLTNSGSVTAPLTIRIIGPVTNPRVTNLTTGLTLGLTITLGAGEFVDIDTAARTVLLAGTADRYSTLTLPQWWGLQPGPNEVRYTADVSTASTVTLTYRSAWI